MITDKTKNSAESQTTGVKIFFAVFLLMMVVIMGPLFALQKYVESSLKDGASGSMNHLLLALAFTVGVSVLVSKAITNKLKRLSAIANLAARARTTGDVHRCEREIKTLGGAREIREIGQSIRKIMAAIKAPSLKEAHPDA
jgi:hypothetical protein